MLLGRYASALSKPTNDVIATKPYVKRVILYRRIYRDGNRRLELTKIILEAICIAGCKYCSSETKVIFE